jgi:serine/threonine protein kinase
MLSFAPRPEAYGIDMDQAAKERYRIVGRIASGSMAQVYLAELRSGRSGSHTREVVLKRLRPELQADRDFVQMFFDEARTASEMDHPNIARTIELGEIDGSFFMAIELVTGVSLKSVIKRLAERRELFPMPMLLRVASSALQALAHAHEVTDRSGRKLRIVHRDVSPANILVGFDGGVKLVDFGLAKAERNLHKTSPGTIKGTFAYMAPEQIRGDSLDGRADLFALAETIYEAATLHHPFFPSGQSAMIDSVLSQGPIDPARFVRAFPPRVRDLLFRALAREPKDRYSHADVMRAAVEAMLRDTPATEDDVAAFISKLFADRYDLVRDARRKRDIEVLLRGLRVEDPIEIEIDVLEPVSEPEIRVPPALLEPPRIPLRTLTPLPTEDVDVHPSTSLGLRRLLVDPGADTIPPDGAQWFLEDRLPARPDIEAYLANWTGPFGITRLGVLKRPAREAEPTAWSAIIHEGRLLGALAHPGFRALYEAGEKDGRPFIVVERSHGMSLAQILERCRETKTEMPAAIACWIVAELASIMAAAELALSDRGPVELALGELSPNIVRITVQGAVQIAELSVARSKLGAGFAVEEVSLYRPERDAMENEKSRVVYALGAILFECVLAAHLGEPGVEPLAVLLSRTCADRMAAWRIPVAISDPVLMVCSQAIAARPVERQANAQALELDLARLLLRLGQPVTRSAVAAWIARLPGARAADG